MHMQPPPAPTLVTTRTRVAVAHGDGIGPEIMDATLRVLAAAGAPLDLVPIAIGEAVYRAGHTSGITPAAWETLRNTRVLLKAPITTPQGGGYKSLNVSIRKTLGLYANVRPCTTYHPFVATRHPGMDVVIVRENEEDLYAGIEHRQTDEVYQCLKLITRPGCERIVRYAFEYARAHGRRKVTCFTKDNIMKMTDGLFHKVFDDIATEYPDLQHEHKIVDIGAALLADRPGQFDVLVMPNLYGDILSDVAAQIAGSVGIAGSANIGDHVAMFEAVHGSAPDLAGKDAANPSALLNGAMMMLVHIGQGALAAQIRNAWLRTLEDGVHTADIQGPETRTAVGTRAFADAVIARLGEKPARLPVAIADSRHGPLRLAAAPRPAPAVKAIVGVDVFLHWRGEPAALGAALAPSQGADFRLAMITNRGVKVWPDGFPETFCTDHWRCRFLAPEGTPSSHGQVVQLLERVQRAGFDFIKTENLCTFDGEAGYSLGQGQ